MAVGNNAYLYFVEVRSPQYETSLKLCNASGAVFPLDVFWGEFLPVADALVIEGLKDGTKVEARNFTFAVQGTSTELIRLLRDSRVVDNDVCIYRSTGTPHVALKSDDPAVPDVTRFLFEDPVVVKLGRIDSYTLSGERTTVQCYTASSDLNAITRTAARWTDTQQRKFINANDYGFKYANRHYRDVGIQTTAASSS